MLDFKTITVGKTAVINITLGVEVNPKLLKGLIGSVCLGEKYSKPELTCAAYSLFQLMDSKLTSSLVEEFKSKFATVSCDAQNGNFIITIACPSNFTAVRKNLSTVCKMLDPIKSFPFYKKYMNLLGLSANKENFIWAANQLTKALNGVKVFICAPFKVDADKKKQLEDRVKLIPASSTKGESKPSEEKVPDGEECAKIKYSNQFDAFMAYKFLKAVKVECSIQDGCVLLNGHKGDSKVLESKYKDSYKHYVDKLVAQGDRLTDIVIMSAANDGFLSASELGSINDGKVAKAALLKIF